MLAEMMTEDASSPWASRRAATGNATTISTRLRQASHVSYESI